MAVIAAAFALALLGNLVQIDDLVFYALIVWIFGLVLTGFGARRGLGLLAGGAAPRLHAAAAAVSLLAGQHRAAGRLLRARRRAGARHGVPVFLEGNVIDLGVYKLQVAEACSGLRYLFPIMSFTYVFAVLYRGPVWHRLVLLSRRCRSRC